MRYLHGHARRARRQHAARARPRASRSPSRTIAAYAQFAIAAAGKEMSTTMAFVRMLGNLLKDKRARPAHRAHRGRRGAHLRHGQPVQAGRHLFERGPALCAGRHRLGAQLPRGHRRPDPRRRHQRSRRHRELDRRGHQLQRARPGDAALLHLLLDVRLPARGRPDLGRGRPAAARLPARRHLGPHHARRRRAAAPGRHQPPDGRDHPELQGLRPGLRGRDGGDRRCRHPRDDGRAEGRLLLRHADERELRAARPAGGRGGRRAARLLPLRAAAATPASTEQGHAARLRRDPDRGGQGGAAAGRRKASTPRSSASRAGASWRATAGLASSARWPAMRSRARPSSRSSWPAAAAR